MVSISIYVLSKDKNHILSGYNLKSTSNNRINIVKNYKNADIIIGFTENLIKKFISRHHTLRNKKYVIFSNSTKDKITFKNKDIYFYNTEDVFYTNIFHNFINNKIDLLEEVNDDFNRKILMLGDYQKNNKKNKGDLESIQSSIALYGYKINMVSIYGENWPKGIVKDKKTALQTMKEHNFCLSFEKKYEKYNISSLFWQSIQNYCLPVYYGSESLYEIFPKNSFIDINDYKSHKELYIFIKSIPEYEFISRINKCIDVVNQYIDSDSYKSRNNTRVEYITDFLLSVKSGSINNVEKIEDGVVKEESDDENDDDISVDDVNDKENDEIKDKIDDNEIIFDKITEDVKLDDNNDNNDNNDNKKNNNDDDSEIIFDTIIEPIDRSLKYMNNNIKNHQDNKEKEEEIKEEKEQENEEDSSNNDVKKEKEEKEIEEDNKIIFDKVTEPVNIQIITKILNDTIQLQEEKEEEIEEDSSNHDVKKEEKNNLIIEKNIFYHTNTTSNTRKVESNTSPTIYKRKNLSFNALYNQLLIKRKFGSYI